MNKLFLILVFMLTANLALADDADNHHEEMPS